MSKKKGIDSTKVIVKFAAELGEAADIVVREGKSFSSVFKAGLKLVDDLAALGKLDKEELRLEFGDLDAEEKKELSEVFAKEFDLPNDYAELLIERGLDLVITDGLGILKKAKAIKKILEDGKAKTLDAKKAEKKEEKKPVEKDPEQ